jgi:hypothetical protein
MAPQEVVARYVQAQHEGGPPSTTVDDGAIDQDQDEYENLVVIEGDYDVVDDITEDRAD